MQEMQRLSEMMALLGERFDEVVELFVTQTALELDNIQKAIAGNDARAARMSAHAIKSNCATLGFDDLQLVSNKMEYLANEERLEEVVDLLESARAAYHEAVEILTSLQSGKGN